MCEPPAHPAPEPIMHMVDSAKQGRLDLVQAAVASGKDVNSRWVKNSTPLMAASRFGHLDLVQFLLEHGANVNLWDAEITPPHSTARINVERRPSAATAAQTTGLHWHHITSGVLTSNVVFGTAFFTCTSAVYTV